MYSTVGLYHDELGGKLEVSTRPRVFKYSPNIWAQLENIARLDYLLLLIVTIDLITRLITCRHVPTRPWVRIGS